MTATAAPEGQITCLFTDIEGSTALSKKPPLTVYQRLRTEHDQLLCACFKKHHGNVVDNPGDGFFVTFDHARDALQCAVAVQECLVANRKTLCIGEQDGNPRFLQVRIGVYGVAREVFQTQGRYIDPEVNLAARVGALGIGGQVIVSESAYTAAREHLPHGWHEWPNLYIRNFDTPQTVYELLWDGGTTRGAPGARWTPAWLLRETNKFIGRETYLRDIVQWLKGEQPLLLLHGQGGVGKTRLTAQAVLAVGSHFKGRIFGVALDTVFGTEGAAVTPRRLAARIAEALDAPPEVLNPLVEATPATSDADETARTAVLIRYLQARFTSEPFLLVLDNFESVDSDATRRFVGEIVRQARTARCLVTCRTHFNLAPFSKSVEVRGLQIPDARTPDLNAVEGVQLFRERVPQLDPLPDLSDTPALIRILQATAGVALYIELVAARVGTPLLTLRDMADGLEQSLLDGQRTDADQFTTRADAARHQSAEACIDWSFQLLPPAEQALYPRLSVFRADFSPDAAQEVADIPLPYLQRWIRVHLLEQAGAGARCLLQPVLREFAANRLPDDAQPPLEAEFAAYYSALAAQNGDLNSPTQRAVLYAELRNLHAAAACLCRHIRQVTDPIDSLNELGIRLNEIPVGIRLENQQQALACYTAALRVYTEADFPLQWAATNNNLGLVYADLPTGDRAQNLQQALACYTAALRVYTEADFPLDWAMTNNNLGATYAALPTGDRAQNLQQALACYTAALRVYTEADFPLEWATTNNNLGIVYKNLPTGDRAQNLQQALACYTAALRVYTEADFPLQWAATNNNLGLVYADLPTGDRAQNLQQALACYTAALRVYTEADFPLDWAMTNNNLGNAYGDLPTGDRAQNLQQALACYTAALRVRTEADFPLEWAETQFNLALTRAQGDDRAGARQAMQQAVVGFRQVGVEDYALQAEAILRRPDWL